MTFSDDALRLGQEPVEHEEEKFDQLWMQATMGTLNVSLFPKEYEHLSEFEDAFREIAREFEERRAQLRGLYRAQGLSMDSAEKKIVAKLLGEVMDRCEEAGFPWPSSLLKVKAALMKEIANEPKPKRNLTGRGGSYV